MDSDRSIAKSEIKDGFFNVVSGNEITLLEEKYNQIIVDILTKKENLSYLRNKEEILPYSNHKKIKIISYMIAFFIFLLGGYFLLTNSQIFLVNSISIFLGIPVLGIIDVRTSKKIMKAIQQKSYNNIIGSLEYKQLLEEINNVSNLLDEKLLEQKKIEKELFECRTKQAILNAEKSIRIVLGNYNNDVETETPVNDSRIKGYSRRLVYNGKNYSR